ncbi:TPA: diguanylate cyclase [Vibrio vulnificus]|uniref:GGDEF domain-containing protein n=1 Tax=Vibrio floridensis TaxID=2908007 RepID=UPI001A306ACC|nr:diguanylate cyclase [Vibrio vulnificus]HAS6346582.1 diguanylate cyclase [Vibrio vulnificus]HDY7752923.1 GGDEF domain-containing protein [Vibrio vulnificus]HDY8119468.1 GGDEF domain-containing protein [Vibrio vulnificus]HDY8205363.1 GGDEF domain-containing protein [Vibrio vulnificus]
MHKTQTSLYKSPFSTTAKLTLLAITLSLLLANILLLKETRTLARSYSDSQNQATWFLFNLSKELSDLVSESRHAEKNSYNIKRVELKYELTWSRFDLLINSRESDSFLSRAEVRVFFVELFEQFQALEPTLQRAVAGEENAAVLFHRGADKLYLSMIDYVARNFRLASPLYRQQQVQAQLLYQAQFVLLGIFVLCAGIMGYFFFKEARFHKKMALTDPLTQLPNRIGLFLHIEKMMEANARFSIYLLDLNGFKTINDTLGHQAGDLALKEVARRLRQLEHSQVRVCRMGGDEFAILCQHTDDDEHQVLNQVIHQLFVPPIQLENGPAKLSTSIGRACFPEDSSNVDTLINIADKRMYRMKFSR